MAEKLTIGNLARLGGVNPQTVRYYERTGLLPKPPRTATGYRIFPNDAPRRLRFIKKAQGLGFSLREIRELLMLRSKPGTSRSVIRKRAQAKIAGIDEKIRSLDRLKQTLRHLTARCERCGPAASCPILESLEELAE